MSVENRLSRLEQKVNTIRGDQRTIFVDNLTSGITIRGKEVRQPVSGVGGGASTGYEGPWAVVKKVNTTNTVTVKASFLTGYYMSQIVGGLTTTYLAADVDITVSATTRIIADITVSGSTYAVTCSAYQSIPAQTIQHYYVTLAWVKVASGVITDIYQCQYGDINISGRVV